MVWSIGLDSLPRVSKGRLGFLSCLAILNYCRPLQKVRATLAELLAWR
ncbi:hypothetical protein PLANPX_5247 [Lacipirellula parvula]|uniref:Uncharacterized protein n=1 Tax=Lacipirellula parvula TaxID=2650471 RepID=A0A5K7XGW8_9BACT|nr:hypothetical protein PLANPX_5247 [Lacipirellula parvula]